MSEKKKLQDRIESELSKWPSAEPSVVAWAIIEALHLSVETRDHFVRLDNNGLQREVASTRIVGAWEAP